MVGLRIVEGEKLAVITCARGTISIFRVLMDLFEFEHVHRNILRRGLVRKPIGCITFNFDLDSEIATVQEPVTLPAAPKHAIPTITMDLLSFPVNHRSRQDVDKRLPGNWLPAGSRPPVPSGNRAAAAPCRRPPKDQWQNGGRKVRMYALAVPE